VVVKSTGNPIIFTFESSKEMGFGISQKLTPDFVSSGVVKNHPSKTNYPFLAINSLILNNGV